MEESDAAKKPEAVQTKHEDIAVAAYYNAQRRGFAGDSELDDWLEAERSLATGAAGSTAVAATQGQPAAAQKADGAQPHADALDTETIEPDQVHLWAQKLAVSAESLRNAVQKAGAKAADVKAYLEKHAPVTPRKSARPSNAPESGR